MLGNAQDNRVLHALGTRYLAQSRRSWPGGDRYVVRSVFEPFVADVNYQPRDCVYTFDASGITRVLRLRTEEDLGRQEYAE